MLHRRIFSVLTSLALVGACLNAPAYAIVNNGTVSTFSSSADLDLDRILYAVNLGGDTSDQTVGGVVFSGTASLPAGVNLDIGTFDDEGEPNVPGFLTASTPADLDAGGTAEDALEEVLRTLTFGTSLSVISDTGVDNTPLFTFDTDEGQAYRLQLLMYDTGFADTRNFDILVEGIVVVDSEEGDIVALGTNPDTTIGRLYTLDFIADADETQVTFAVGFNLDGTYDPNPIINAVTLAIIPEPSSLTLLCLLSIGVGGLGRWRSR